jgi:restriction system protein
MPEVAAILDSVEILSNEIQYWFVRTDSGDNFETFYEKGFIGIGWNEITLLDIQTKTDIEIKRKIALTKGYEFDNPTGKLKSTFAYNKIINFNNLKKGDVIIMPGRASARLAFGIIIDESIYTETVDLQDCDYRKRRKVKWIRKESLHDLDNIFYKIVTSRHAIYNINKYANYIDNVIDSLYEKNGFTHFVLDIKKSSEIDLDSLIDLMTSIKSLAHSINQEFGFGEENNLLSIRLNVQSPGLVEIKRQVGKTIVVLSLLFSACDGGNIKQTGNPQVDSFAQQHIATLNKIDTAMTNLEIDRERINNH